MGPSIITYTEFWAIELFVQIAKSLQIESVASNHIIWVFELIVLEMLLVRIV